MADVPVLGTLTPWRIKREMGAKAERMLEALVGKVVAAVASQGFGKRVIEGVYLAGFEHGATMMEKRMNAQADRTLKAPSDGDSNG